MMDPDATLEAIVDARQEMESTRAGSEDWCSAAGRLNDNIGYLNEWLQKGGALPKAWQLTVSNDPRRALEQLR